MPKLKAISIEGEKFFASLSFDIDDFIGDGIWWLQIYNDKREIIYDKPFASSRNKLDALRVKEVIKNEFLTPRSISL